ncbi:MAG: GNAT family N-acetyltransferase [Gaiellaceae bacterium]
MAADASIPRRRVYTGEDDLRELGALLRRAYARDRRWNAWSAVRFDVSSHRLADRYLRDDVSWLERIAVWEADGEIVAAALLDAEGPGDGVVMAVPPAAVEDEQLTWLEEHHDASAVSEPLVIEAGGNTRLRDVLTERGYAPIDGHWIIRERPLAPADHDAVRATPPYRIKHIETRAELMAYHVAVESVFGRGGPAVVAEYQFRQRTPSYVPELCLVAVDDTGAVGAFANAWLDEVNNVAELEPVGTAPAHRRRGLAAAVVAEACNRLRALACPLATVYASSRSDAANAFYDAAGFSANGVVLNWSRG